MSQLHPALRIYIGGLLLIFGLISFHAPITVWLSSSWPEQELLIKSWKELLLGALLLPAIYITEKYKLRQRLIGDRLFVTVLFYALLHVFLAVLFFGSLQSTVAGLMIDLRYLLFFVLVYIAILLVPLARRWFLMVGAAAAFVVVLFSVLQVLALPPDVLSYIGYGRDTIAPFLTVDQNTDYIRINGTLRGPNPLGAYMLIALTMVAAAVAYRRQTRQTLYACMILAVGAFMALYASYSRSAIVGTAIALSVIVVVKLGSKVTYKVMAIAGLAGVLLLGGGLYVVQDSSLYQHVILHEDPDEPNMVNSNDGHIDSLREGADRVLTQPFGAGIGSTGSASLLTDEPFILENQYLYIAHEAGWLGVILFIVIFVVILKRLWCKRSDWLALGVFASGVGLAIVGILLPVWVDDTVSLVWWGLAAIALATPTLKKEIKHGRSSASAKQKTT